MTGIPHQWKRLGSGTSEAWAEVCTLCGAELKYAIDEEGETTVAYLPPEGRPSCSEVEDGNGNETADGGGNP